MKIRESVKKYYNLSDIMFYTNNSKTSATLTEQSIFNIYCLIKNYKSV
jgi:hypothetical protein